MIADLGVCQLHELTAEDAAWAGPELAAREPWLTLGYAAEPLTAYLKSGDPCLARLTVWVNGERAGVTALRYPWLRGPFLELLAITRPGQGLGSAIVRWLAERSQHNLWTSCTSFNTAARRFYERQGFEQAAILPDLIKPGFDEVLLRMKR